MKSILQLPVIAVLAMAVLIPHVAHGQAGDPELQSLPELRLDDVAEPIRDALLQAQVRIDRAVAEDAADEVLAEAYGHYADVSFAHGMIGHARVAYQNAVALRPNRQEWHYLLGLVEISEGDLEAGIAALSRALDLYRADLAALIHRGRAYLEAGQVDRAELDFLLVHEAAPNTPAALSGLGRVALQREDYQQAVKWLEQALAVSPQANRLHHLLGNAYRGLGETERAREHLARGGEIEVPMRDPALNQVRQLSRSPQFYLEMGLSQADAGNLAGAAQFLARARELAPDDEDILREHGELLARLGQLDQAHAAFSRLAERTPDSAEAQYYLGQIEELRGNHDQALAAYRKTLELDPDHDRAEEAMAYVTLASGQIDQARAAFDRLAEAEEDLVRVAHFRYWRAIAELAAGDCDGALQSLEEAYALTDRYEAAVLTALARVRATCGQATGADLDQAVEWATLLYDNRPGLETAATLAMAMAAAGRFEDAVDYQAQAMFEALKTDGDLEKHPELQANMDRYRNRQPAERPFGPDDPVFSGGIGRL